MHVRTMQTAAAALAIALLTVPLSAVDRDFLSAWERAQRDRPQSLTSAARIAPSGEPGTPLTIEGRVVDAEGRAIRDAVVFAWQTDNTGVYDRPGTPLHSWRLRGWVRTGERGTFTFTTIRPAPYPGRVARAHVHFTVTRSNGQRYFVDDLEFDEGKPMPIAKVVLRLEEKGKF